MTIVVKIVDAYVDGDTPANACTYSVNFLTSDGLFSSSAILNSNVLQTTPQMQLDVSIQVAALVNAAKGTFLTFADVRIL